MSGPRAELRVRWAEGGFVPVPRPRLTWRTTTDAADWMQRRAEIELRHGDAVRTAAIGGAASGTPWPFDTLLPGRTVRLRVRVEGEDGARGDWSPSVDVAYGGAEADDWARADWIGGSDDAPTLLRLDFTLDAPVRRAVLRSSAYGAIDVEINGRPISDRTLSPGWTSYQWRVVHDTDDVTRLLGTGANTLGVRLAGGWYTEAYGFRDAAARFYDGPPRTRILLDVEHTDGSTSRIATGPDWTRARGGTTESSLYQGETHDARAEPDGWSRPGGGEHWTAVTAHGGDLPEPRISPPVRVVEDIAPVAITAVGPDRWRLDFGQNLVGRLRITVDGERGRALHIRHAEVLEHDELGTRPLRNAAATDRYVLAGGGPETWEPRATFHGFRYAEIDGWPGTLRAQDVVARVIHSDMARTGGFRTSHPLLQRFHDNVVWGMRGNFLSVPTDCPQRDERLGWTGDAQVFAPTAAFLYDADAFLRSWLHDVRLEQRAQGGIVPMVVPAVIPQVPGLLEPVAAWGDAITVVPSVLDLAHDDPAAIEESYDAMRDWLDVVHRRAGDPLLWEDGIQFGDWLDPDAPPDQPGQAKTDPDIIATAYFHRSAAITAAAADRLGRPDEAARYRALADAVRLRFRAAYITPDGRMMSDSPTAYALAIVFDLADATTVDAMGDRLRHLVRRSGYRISTGFVGTPIICDALTRTGHDDAASRLLLQTESPSWLHPVTMGATTVWERWDSMLEDGSINPGQMTSFNHYALGAVADWLHRRVAGIDPVDPGYGRIRIAPIPLTGLDDASAWFDSPHGRIETGWRRTADSIDVDILLPPNVRASIDLPDGRHEERGSGRHRFTVALPVPEPITTTPTLDDPMTDVLDHPAAYAAFTTAFHAADPDRARAFRRSTRWTPGRTLRDPLNKTPVETVEELGRALRGVRTPPERMEG